MKNEIITTVKASTVTATSVADVCATDNSHREAIHHYWNGNSPTGYRAVRSGWLNPATRIKSGQRFCVSGR